MKEWKSVKKGKRRGKHFKSKGLGHVEPLSKGTKSLKIPRVKVRRTKKYIRIRVRDPNEFELGSLRTHDIGREGHSKRIAGKLKSTSGWATQAFLVAKDDEHLVPKFTEQAQQLRQTLKAS